MENCCLLCQISPLSYAHPMSLESFAAYISILSTLFVGTLFKFTLKSHHWKEAFGMIAGLKFDIFCKEENLGGLTLSKCAGPFLALAIIAYSFCALDELDVSSAHHGLHSPLRLNHNASSRPRVVVMIPARKGLHSKIVEKAALALRALETGNPELDLYTFVFDKIIPMCAAAPARPVLTFPDSNSVAASGGTGGRCPRWRGCATSCWILSRSSGTALSNWPT